MKSIFKTLVKFWCFLLKMFQQQFCSYNKFAWGQRKVNKAKFGSFSVSFFLRAKMSQALAGRARAQRGRAPNLRSSAKSPVFRCLQPAQARVADESHVMRATAVISSDIQRLQEKRKKWARQFTRNLLPINSPRKR